jgi:hypothetical protein
MVVGGALGVLQADPSDGGTTIQADRYFSSDPASPPVDDLRSLVDISLRYTYKSEKGSVAVLRDEMQRPYLPLPDVAAFFGVKCVFQPQVRRVELTRGARKVVTVLSQNFALVEGNETLMLAPLEMVNGQVAVEPEANTAPWWSVE